MSQRTCRLCGKTIKDSDFALGSKKGHVCSACLARLMPADPGREQARPGLPASARRRAAVGLAMSL